MAKEIDLSGIEDILASESKAVEPSYNDDIESTGMSESLLRGLAQGASFGFADELTAALESAASDKSYEDSLAESRQNYKIAESDNPYTYTAGQLLSALIPGAGIGGTALKGLSKLGTAEKALALAKVGATTGALSAAGSTENELLSKEGLQDVAMGATVGVPASIILGQTLPSVVNKTAEVLGSQPFIQRLGQQVSEGYKGTKLSGKGVSTELTEKTGDVAESLIPILHEIKATNKKAYDEIFKKVTPETLTKIDDAALTELKDQAGLLLSADSADKLSTAQKNMSAILDDLAGVTKKKVEKIELVPKYSPEKIMQDANRMKGLGEHSAADRIARNRVKELLEDDALKELQAEFPESYKVTQSKLQKADSELNLYKGAFESLKDTIKNKKLELKELKNKALGLKDNPEEARNLKSAIESLSTDIYQKEAGLVSLQNNMKTSERDVKLLSKALTSDEKNLVKQAQQLAKDRLDDNVKLIEELRESILASGRTKSSPFRSEFSPSDNIEILATTRGDNTLNTVAVPLKEKRTTEIVSELTKNNLTREDLKTAAQKLQNEVIDKTDDIKEREVAVALKKKLEGMYKGTLTPEEQATLATLNDKYQEIKTLPETLGIYSTPDESKGFISNKDAFAIKKAKDFLRKVGMKYSDNPADTEIVNFKKTLEKAKNIAPEQAEKINEFQSKLTESSQLRDLSLDLIDQMKLGGDVSKGFMSPTAIASNVARGVGETGKSLRSLTPDALVDLAYKAKNTELSKALIKMASQPMSKRNALIFALEQQPSMREALDGLLGRK